MASRPRPSPSPGPNHHHACTHAHSALRVRRSLSCTHSLSREYPQGPGTAAPVQYPLTAGAEGEHSPACQGLEGPVYVPQLRSLWHLVGRDGRRRVLHGGRSRVRRATLAGADVGESRCRCGCVCSFVCFRYTLERKQFGVPLAKTQLIQESPPRRGRPVRAVSGTAVIGAR